METIEIDLRELQQHPAYKTILKTMLILSDLQKSDLGLSEIFSSETVFSELTKKSILIYYIRNQFSIIDQSLLLYNILIKDELKHFKDLRDDDFISEENNINSLVDQNWRNYISHIRDKIGHHYDDDIIKYSRKKDFLDKRNIFKITRGENIYEWEFELAHYISEEYLLEYSPKQYGIFLSKMDVIKRLNSIRDAFLDYYAEIIWAFFEKFPNKAIRKNNVKPPKIEPPDESKMALQALKRAATEARRIAIKTNTGIIVRRDNEIYKLSASDLISEEIENVLNKVASPKLDDS